ncbi:hypothetical protein N7533_012986 [Penicillium manginii]|uniref:uncharacterized protein n=1 Tax=Penicillium manginii TaxID=203109 RepID=UPI002547C6FE|nr:uncharacterized protein N7533_012986 [Penicillium manginii]KAJ5734583.1 hypothetical protein N7533_012986 [Penicillium manginii]
MVRFTNAASPYSYPYSIGNLSLKHLVESDTWDFTFELTARNPWGEALGSTTCHTTWMNGGVDVPPQAPVACDDTLYHFFLSTDAPDVENYDLAIEGPMGTGAITLASGNKYRCGAYTDPIDNVDEECKTVNGGEFYVKV